MRALRTTRSFLVYGFFGGMAGMILVPPETHEQRAVAFSLLLAFVCTIAVDMLESWLNPRE